MSHTREKRDVLIVGAGPTGLVLALCLVRLGVRFRIVDKSSEPGTTSRALVVHPRTLEFYRQLGVADAVVDAAQKFMAVNLWVRGKIRGRMEFGDIGVTLSKFPYSLIFPQDEHERVLIDALRRGGVEIERRTDVLDISHRDDSVVTTLRLPDGTEEIYASSYVAGCDGAHSRVRESLHVDLPGGTYSHLWYVADVEATGPITNREVNISMDERDVLAVFPMRGSGRARLIGQAPPARDGSAVTWADVSQRPLRQLRTDVRKVNWFSAYRVHHRVAATFRKGRVFLLGDAAHLHSPVGGQGMNTGIGDAVNLAWKLASVLLASASSDLLASYESERMAFARGLVATTDRVFMILNSKGALAQLLRTAIAPTVMPLIFRNPRGRRIAFGVLSQIAVRYRHSALSRGRAGSIRGGDRLPWVSTTGDANGFEDNFAPLGAMNWQVHLYGEPSVALRRLCELHCLPLHLFAWRAPMRRVGLSQNALYLVRPDEHVAFADRSGSAGALERYIRESTGLYPSRKEAIQA
jgi:2-polyprenyl-6-methoxyphenol hydroxylase-like FAD-dependent oxidoreductase